MFSMQVFIDIYVSPFNPRFKSLRCTLNGVLGNLLGFSGCLLLDPLRFGSCHLLVIGRWVKEMHL